MPNNYSVANSLKGSGDKAEVLENNLENNLKDVTYDGEIRAAGQPNPDDFKELNPKVEQTKEPETQTTGMSYDDIAGNKQPYKPNSGVDDKGNPLIGGGSNTGQGAAAAVGTTFSWDKTAAEKAKSTYSKDVLTAKQNLLTNRQTMENNALSYQKQADMMQYSNNQNAEKVGWTGGYVLDQNRQAEYLKQSIQAQMYGAMELQKYGHDSALAAARLSYDLNQQEYARQYYQDAVSAALSEAQLTGVYFSAETKDMMAQLAVAQQKLKEETNDDGSLTEEGKKAQNIINTIDGWFSSNGISKEGVKTLEAWQTEQAQELQWSQELWTRYQAAIESANTDISQDSSKFIMLDPNGRELWDGTKVTVGNWETMDAKTIGDYLLTGGIDENGNPTLNTQAVNQFYSYLDSTLVGQIESGYSKWCSEKGYTKTDKDGKTTATSNVNASTLLDYIEESGIIEKLKNKYGKDLSDDEKYSGLYDMFMGWDFTIQMPDGKQTTYTYKDLMNIEKYRDEHGLNDGKPKVDNRGGVVVNSEGVVVKSGTPSFIYSDHSSTAKLQKDLIDTSHYDDDFDYDIGEGLGDGKKNYNYDIDVDWVGNESGCAVGTFQKAYPTNTIDQWNKCQTYLKAAYPGAKDGDLAFDQYDILWIYYDGKWGYIQQSNLGGQRLKEDMITYVNGKTPSRWK